MSNVGENREPLSIGDEVGDFKVTEKLGGGGGIHLWSGVRADGGTAVVFGLDRALGRKTRSKFLEHVTASANAKDPEQTGFVRIISADPVTGAYVGDTKANGTFADLPILNWPRKRRVSLFRQLCEIVGELHEKGLAHGWLRPENILLDGDFQPVVANTGALDIAEHCRTDGQMVALHRIYAPPEVRQGGGANQRADTYALGRLLHFALTGKQSEEKDERLPRLEVLLKDTPNALVRIIRKCTALDPQDRYGNALEIVKEIDRVARHVPVGLPHPDIDGQEESSMVDDERFLSAPPPKKSSVRSTGVAIEMTPPSDKGEHRFWSPSIAVGLGLVGAAMIGVPLFATHMFGGDSFVFEAVLWGAALPLGFATPGLAKARILTRVLTSLVITLILVKSAPLDAIRDGRKSGLTAEDVALRVEAFKELKKGGETNFQSVDLSGADLSGMDFSGVLLDAALLNNANLSNAKFSRTSMENTDVSGADISGASFLDVPGAWMKGLDLAKCSGTTVMPSGYTCMEKIPVPSVTK